MHYLTIHCKTDIADEKKLTFEIVKLLSSCLWGYHDWGFFNAWTSIYKWNTSNCIQNTFGISLFRIDMSSVSLFEIKVHAWKFGQHHFFLLENVKIIHHYDIFCFIAAHLATQSVTQSKCPHTKMSYLQRTAHFLL